MTALCSLRLMTATGHNFGMRAAVSWCAVVVALCVCGSVDALESGCVTHPLRLAERTAPPGRQVCTERAQASCGEGDHKLITLACMHLPHRTDFQ